MKWVDIFHRLIIPFLGGFALTLAKLIADHKPLSFEEPNDIGLDMVLLGSARWVRFISKAARSRA